MNSTLVAGLLAVGLASLVSLPVSAQVQTQVPPVVAGAKPVTMEYLKVHGVSLEGNLGGEAVDRDVLIFLPPGYAANKGRRYPVLYALHGYSIGAEQWTREIHVPQTIEGAFARGAKNMIVVLPDSKTLYGGSIYTSSVTTGDFDRFISKDLVAYIDSHYRTLADRQSRGLAGHSMGGYGTARIGMRHPEVFGALYIMSPGLLAPHPAELPRMGPAVQSPEEVQKGFEAAVAHLKSPRDAANLPMASQAQLAVAAFDRNGIAAEFEVYSGTHTSAVADRFQNHVLPFFSRHLVAGPRITS